jgi:hypothetical protein
MKSLQPLMNYQYVTDILQVYVAIIEATTKASEKYRIFWVFGVVTILVSNMHFHNKLLTVIRNMQFSV